jgi:hypothetical protein
MHIVDTTEVPLVDLKPYPGNPRTHDLAVIKQSLEKNGQYRAVVVQKKGLRILAGHGTCEAARDLGWSEVLVHLVHCTSAEAKRIVAVDNRASDLGGYDDQLLADLLKSMGELDGSGYVDDDLDRLLRSLDGPEASTEPSALPAVPLTSPGDLIMLGRHRLLCGDATNPEHVARLADGARAQMLWTDPPYGVDYTGKTERALKLDGDHPQSVEALLRNSFAAVDVILEPGSALYVAHPAGQLSLVFGRCFLEPGWRLHETLIWVKDSMVLGHADYHYRHEPILYGYSSGARGRRGRGGPGRGAGLPLKHDAPRGAGQG